MEEFRKYYLEMARKELGLLNAKGLDLIRGIIVELTKDGSEYSARTSAARLEEIRRERRQAEKEQQAREAWEAENQRNAAPRYERNETMKILGKQSVGEILSADPVISKMYEDLMEAERQARPNENGCFQMDLCVLGFLAGIRSEKRKKRKVAPVQQGAKSRARAAQASQGQGRKGKADK